MLFLLSDTMPEINSIAGFYPLSYKYHHVFSSCIFNPLNGTTSLGITTLSSSVDFPKNLVHRNCLKSYQVDIPHVMPFTDLSSCHQLAIVSSTRRYARL